MQDVPIPHDRVQDPFERNVPGLGFGRDPERTPMQWDALGRRRLHHRQPLAADLPRLGPGERGGAGGGPARCSPSTAA